MADGPKQKKSPRKSTGGSAKKSTSTTKRATSKTAATNKATASRSTKSATVQVKRERIAIVAGARSPFTKSWSTLNDVSPVELSTQVARELFFRNDVDLSWVDHIVWGTVVSVPASPNVGREVALNLGMYRTPGVAVSRACATGFQSIATAAEMIWAGQARCVLAGGVDVTSAAPVLHRKHVIDTLQKAQKAKGMQLVKTLASVNPLHLMPSPPKLTERYTGLTMGEHAELMAQYFNITREAQEEFAVASHRKAQAAVDAGHISEQLVPIKTDHDTVTNDNLIRSDMSMEKLKRLKPVFDRKHGTITAATSSALTDGAACVLVMSESRAKELGYTPLGYVRSYAFPALDPRENMLLGNVYACPDALERAGTSLQDMDLVEIHEAFAAQVLSNLKCFDDQGFFDEKMGRSKAIGQVDPERLNVWGGSMAFGHPFAATGGRIVMNLLQGLKHTDGTLGLATACAAGGLGSAMVLERGA